MPDITDTPPTAVQQDLTNLRAALQQAIPHKTAQNFLVATWNIRAFGSLARKWTAGSSDTPKRDLRGLRAIIEILSRFDVSNRPICDVVVLNSCLRESVGFVHDDEDFRDGSSNDTETTSTPRLAITC